MNKEKKILIYPRVCPWYFDEIINNEDPNLPEGKISLVTDEFFTSKYKNYKGLEEILFYPSAGKKNRILKLFSLLNYIRKNKYDMAVMLTSHTKKDVFSLAMLFFVFFPVKKKYDYTLTRELYEISSLLIIKTIISYIIKMFGRGFDIVFSSGLLFFLALWVVILKGLKKIEKITGL